MLAVLLVLFPELYGSEAIEKYNVESPISIVGDELIYVEDTESENIIVEDSQGTKSNAFKNKMPYYIKVNKKQNVVNIYQIDENGEYTIPVMAMACSTGRATPKAGSKYKITTYKTQWNKLKGNVYGQYATQIVGNILFHSVPYTRKSKDSLEYWEYDKLGEDASLGCIRLSVANAKWIYDNAWTGTWVEFYEDDDPGPFGKPETQTISDNELCRNWDPTDYVEGNPWHIEPEVSGDEITVSNIEVSGDK